VDECKPLMYGLRCEGIMHAVKNNLSLDNLSRLLVDVQVDSSKIIDNLVRRCRLTL